MAVSKTNNDQIFTGDVTFIGKVDHQGLTRGIFNTSLVNAFVRSAIVQVAPNNNTYLGLEYSPELNLLVAVAASGVGDRVMTSIDGTVWTAGTSAADNNWEAVAWSPELSLFVAVARSGTGDRVMTSPDGLAWTTRTSAADNDWRAVVWAAELGLFVAVARSGSGNRVMTSGDGFDWDSQSSPDRDWRDIIWAPELGLLVAVGQSGTASQHIMTSPDGINWTAQTLPADVDLAGVEWSPELSLLVAVGNSGTNRVAVSGNGIDWDVIPSADDTQLWQSIAWSPEFGVFMSQALFNAEPSLMTSPDGINWTKRTVASANDYVDLVWASGIGRFVGVSDSAPAVDKVMTSL